MSVSTALIAPHVITAAPETKLPRYSLAHVMAMPIAFALIVLLTRLAAG